MPEPAPDLQAAFARALRGDLGPLPPGPQGVPREEIAAAHRRRIVAGMADALAVHGIAGTTVADIVREAQVSRRTFYELFGDKTSCLLATYDACADLTMAFVEAAVAPDQGAAWQERVTAGLGAYLRIMASLPGLAHVFLVEMPSAGPEAMAHVLAGHKRFAALLSRLTEEHRDDLPDGSEIDDLAAAALVGAINELVVQALAAGDDPNSPARQRTAMRLLLGTMQPLPAELR